jgi:DNA-binding MarR family transcriptional regulator
MPEQDHIDRFLKRLEPLKELDIDLEVEGIVDRIGGINRRIKRGMEATLAEHDLTHPDWQVLTSLRLHIPDHRSSPGALAADLELSSGAMTSRLDRLEQLGFVQRLPAPGDRRAVVIELTAEGRKAWDRAASTQGRRELFFASALTKVEQRQLNTLLRKLMLAVEKHDPAERSATAKATELQAGAAPVLRPRCPTSPSTARSSASRGRCRRRRRPPGRLGRRCVRST